MRPLLFPVVRPALISVVGAALAALVTVAFPGGLPAQERAAASHAAPPHPTPNRAEAPVLDTLTLEAAARGALETHPLTGAGRAGVDAARARARTARSDRLPSLALSGSLTRFEEPMVVAPLHGFDPTVPPAFDRTLIQDRLTLDYTLFDGGARSARVRRADAGLGAARAALRIREMELLADVVAAYVEVETLRVVAASHRERMAALQAEAERVERFLEEGTAPRVELLRARAALSDALAEARSAEARLAMAERELERVAGLPHGEASELLLPPLRLEEEARLPVDDPSARDGEPAVAGEPLAPGWPAPADAPNPALEEARHRVDAAEAAADEAGARYWPDVEAGAGLQQYGSSDGDFATEWQAGIRVSYPLFTGGARDAEVERTRAELRMANEELRLRRYGVEEAGEAARTAWVEATARARALAESVEQHEEVARIEALALAEGAGVQSDFLRAEAALLRARAGLAEARGGAVLAAVQWARARGVLTLEWLLQHVEAER